MNHQAHTIGSLERRIRDAEKDLFAAVGADVEEFFLELAQTGLRVRVLSHGRGPAVVCSTACRRAPPSGRRCLPSSVNSGSSPWTFLVTACPTRSSSGAGRYASSPAG
jgi:hypothetical protein